MAIQHLRGLAADWTADNRTLLAGQLGIETDTRKIKIGDGTNNWNDLLYAIGNTGSAGPAGANGANGANGTDGATWHIGSFSPGSEPGYGIGVDGDLALGQGRYVFSKSAGVWGYVTDLKGPTGDTGSQGIQGIQGIQGVAGADGATWSTGSGIPNILNGVENDLYLDTSNGDVYVKGAVNWGSPIANITGPQGLTGPAGSGGSGSAIYAEPVIILGGNTGVVYADASAELVPNFVMTSTGDIVSAGVY